MEGTCLCCQLRHVPPVQMPFASLTVGQVFFAVVHEKTRPPWMPLIGPNRNSQRRTTGAHSAPPSASVCWQAL